MRIGRISAQAFRGFPGRMNFPLSLGVNLIYAKNGSGKTSIAEAFEWTLYGVVARKERSQTRAEFGQTFLRSAHAQPDLETWAEVEILNDKNEPLVVRRTLTLSGGSTLIANGKTISSVAEIGVAIGQAFRPVLGQSEIKAFIDTAPVDRWTQISAILGLEGFKAIRDQLLELKNNTDTKIPKLLTMREGARRAVSPMLPDGEDGLAKDPESLRYLCAVELGLEETVKWLAISEAAEKAINTLLSQDKKPAGLDSLIIGPELINSEQLADEVADIDRKLEAHRQWHKANRQSKFVAMGLPLANRPVCPFCKEETLTTEKLAELKSEAEAGGNEPPEINEGFKIASSKFEVLKEAPVNTRVVGSLVEAVASEETLVNSLNGLIERQGKLQSDYVELSGLLQGYKVATYSTDATTPLADVASLGQQIVERTSALADEYTRLRTDAQNVKEAVLAKFSGLNDKERRHLERLQAINRLAVNSQIVLRVWEVRKCQIELQILIKQLESAERDMVQSRVVELEEDVREFYDALSPSRSLEFGGFKIKAGARRQAELKATAYGTEINPTSMFSEAQGNSLGLSLYFSQRVKRNPGWATILLDDPVQSMDEDHKENLISLLARLQTEHQIIVFTHDKEFRASLAAQFTPEPRYYEYEITKTDVSPEPKVTPRMDRFGHLLDYAEQMADGSTEERESAFNAIRKSMEHLTKRLAKDFNVRLSRGADLDVHINELAGRPLTTTQVGTLLRIKKNCNPNSHDTTNQDAPGIIRGYITEVRMIKLAHIPESDAVNQAQV